MKAEADVSRRQNNGRFLSAPEVKAIVDNQRLVEDEEITSMLRVPAYLYSSNGVLLILNDGTGVFWESRDRLVRETRILSNAPPVHLLAGRLLYGEKFANQAKRLANSVSKLFGIPAKSLDLSVGSLKLVDKAVIRMGVDRCVTKTRFSALVAYLGEVARKQHNGSWEMRLNSDGITWEPWVVLSDGRQFAPFSIVFRELSENEGSIHGAALL